MKETSLTQAVDQVVQLKMKAVDALMTQLVEPLQDLGNPEKIINKPYEDWSAQDIQWLGQVYGTKEPNLLSNFIFRKELERTQKLEQGARNA